MTLPGASLRGTSNTYTFIAIATEYRVDSDDVNCKIRFPGIYSWSIFAIRQARRKHNYFLNITQNYPS